MQNVSAEFKAAVNAPTRNIKLYVMLIGKNETGYTNARVYTSDDILMSLKIVDGQTNGGFSLGGTICPSLTVELYKTAIVNVGDKIMVKLLLPDIGSLTLASEFTVDTISRKPNGVWLVAALGNMIKLAKNYVSALTYPTTQLEILEEIATQTGYELSGAVSGELINNPQIFTKPIKGEAEDGTTLYYTRREMLGYAAAINGGAAYIDQYGKINIARHNDTGETFTHERVFSENITEPFTINSVRWNSTGLTYSLGDDYDEDTIEFYNPLNYTARELIAHNLETDLIGFGYDGAIIKKQGCGYFEAGDIVHYADYNGTIHNLLVLGIVYEFTDGYFTETLYSLANSNTQRQYAGTEIVSNQIGGGQAKPVTVDARLSSYRYLSDTSIDFNGTVYVVEKNENGLIIKITNDKGNEFAPDIDGDITDVAYHNAVFTAVAMLCGVGSGTSSELLPAMDGVNWYYDAEHIDSVTEWRNLAGTTPMALSGVSYDGGVLTIPGGGYATVDTELVDDNTFAGDVTFYVVAGHVSGDSSRGYTQWAGFGNRSNASYREITIQNDAGGTLRATTMSSDIAFTNAPTTVFGNNYYVIAAQRSGSTLTVYLNGVKGNNGPCNDFSSIFVMGGYYRNGGITCNSRTVHYKCVAIAGQAHDEADILTNMNWLMNKYGIT